MEALPQEISTKEASKESKAKPIEPFFDIKNKERPGYVNFSKIEPVELSPGLMKPRAKELGCYSKRRVYLHEQPCECTDTITCARCVQAKLEAGKKEKPLYLACKERGVRKTARLLGLPQRTVNHWIERGNIPSKYHEKVVKALGA